MATKPTLDDPKPPATGGWQQLSASRRTGQMQGAPGRKGRGKKIVTTTIQISDGEMVVGDAVHVLASAEGGGAVDMRILEPTNDHLAEALVVVFGRWSLNGAQQLRLLGLNAESRSSLRRLQGSHPILPGGVDTLTRVRLLLDIYNQVEDTWGGTPLADTWLTTGNKAFEGQSPLEYIGTDILRLARVQQYLQQGA